jgi:hypothetical protein
MLLLLTQPQLGELPGNEELTTSPTFVTVDQDDDTLLKNARWNARFM